MRWPVAPLVTLALIWVACAGSDASTNTSTASSTTGAGATTSVASTAPTTRDLVIAHPGGFDLIGTVTVPAGAGPHPAALLVSGTGGHDRDGTTGTHTPLADLAAALAETGIATLRFDDRGVGGSRGDASGATTVDLAGDVAAAFAALVTVDEVDPARSGIIGHGEGGLMAAIAIDSTADAAFVVLLATPALPGTEFLLAQQSDILLSEGTSPDEVEWQLGWVARLVDLAASDQPDGDVRSAMEGIVEAAIQDAPNPAFALMDTENRARIVAQTVDVYLDPWMRAFLRLDPGTVLGAIDVPVLAVYGGTDRQVSTDSNLAAARAALAGVDDATVEVLPGLNHLFVASESGSVSEYPLLPPGTDPALADLIAGWILEQVG